MSVTIDVLKIHYSFSACLSPLFCSAIFDNSFDKLRPSKFCLFLHYNLKKELVFTTHRGVYNFVDPPYQPHPSLRPREIQPIRPSLEDLSLWGLSFESLNLWGLGLENFSLTIFPSDISLYESFGIVLSQWWARSESTGGYSSKFFPGGIAWFFKMV